MRIHDKSVCSLSPPALTPCAVIAARMHGHPHTSVMQFQSQPQREKSRGFCQSQILHHVSFQPNDPGPEIRPALLQNRQKNPAVHVPWKGFSAADCATRVLLVLQTAKQAVFPAPILQASPPPLTPTLFWVINGQQLVPINAGKRGLSSELGLKLMWRLRELAVCTWLKRGYF